jgi:hypothetical protein
MKVFAKKVENERNRDKNRGQTAAETGTNLKVNAIGKKGNAVSSDRRRISGANGMKSAARKSGKMAGKREEKNRGNILSRSHGPSRKSHKKQSSAHKKRGEYACIRFAGF